MTQSRLTLCAAVSMVVLLIALSQPSAWAPNLVFSNQPVVSEADLDAALQRTATATLGSRKGTIIVLDPQSGRVRAVVNPSIAFGRASAPGSTIKPFAALTGLRSNLIDKNSRLICRERYAHNEVDTACSHTKDLPPLGPATAIAYSCNYYFARLGEGLREPEFRATLSSFGFGRRTGINMKDEAAGTVAGGKWTPYAVLGEGAYTQVTAGQLISAYAALVNGGKLFRPEIAGANDFQPTMPEMIEIDPAHRTEIVTGMLGAVQFGTAKRAALESAPLYVFGKTGTSTLSRGFRTQGWFVGFAGDSEPPGIPPESVRLAVLVLVDRSHGSDAAALARPVFEEFSRLSAQERQAEKKGNETSGHDMSANGVVPASLSGNSLSSSTVRVHLVRENVTLDLSFEDYVLGVVNTEGSVEDQPEALRALAIAARTYATKNRGRHEREGFDFCTTTHCQRFAVAQTSVCDTPRIIDSVRSTTNEVLLDHRGQIADTYFGASCGGATANIQTLWGGQRLTYLRGVHDDYCAAMPHHDWLDVISRPQLLAALNSDPRTNIGSRLDDIVVTRRDDSGRAEMVSLEGEQRKIVRGWDFKIIVGRSLGWNKLKSSKFSITRSGNDFVFRGSGFGHGLGLCQEGAHVMAQRGMNYRQILEHYFPGITLGRVSTIAELVSSSTHPRDGTILECADLSALSPGCDLTQPFSASTGATRRQAAAGQSGDRSPHSKATPPWKADLLPSAQMPLNRFSLRESNTRVNLSSENFRVTYPSQLDRRDAEFVLKTLETDRADLLRRISSTSIVASFPTLEVHINNTTGDFVGRTGQPWWAAAATRGNHIELQPLAVLKRRGVLATTLRHELAHAFIHAAGHGRTPRWLEEGFALHLAGEGKMILRYPSRSPTVREGSLEELESKLSQPVSADQMRALYAAAYREVSRMIQSEGEAGVWRRIAGQKPKVGVQFRSFRA
ncbi:MAG: SpoIID/LytB domain-containing protein [Pyrinomonadaceae bacterium]